MGSFRGGATKRKLLRSTMTQRVEDAQGHRRVGIVLARARVRRAALERRELAQVPVLGLEHGTVGQAHPQRLLRAALVAGDGLDELPRGRDRQPRGAVFQLGADLRRRHHGLAADERDVGLRDPLHQRVDLVGLGQLARRTRSHGGLDLVVLEHARVGAAAAEREQPRDRVGPPSELA
ncbi:MAG: hypothetical protein U0168_24865 [Nannocystaceae bacterium]